ncbi:(d)CMP kinase [Bacillus alkalicellulosilyticus]|uniref:(d)CMP kinase n=1 Tax=Alkalihalobacterium alkalicellulosilyticum TaxID=1912214 RepID=UPI000998D5DB|nr:(d)CMP kinase [Bacillus alkalicellulosilyticus]
MKKINIAIDGPAGAGKSTVAKIVADRLTYLYIDTGAMYRALTYLAISSGVNPEDGVKLKELLDASSIQLEVTEKGTDVYVNNKIVTEDIRSSEVTNLVSIIASHREIRETMVQLQQGMAEQGGAVMDGRDIGTHVLPDAEVKIFLTASVEERARRRHEENLAKGRESDLYILQQEIQRRDELDMNREVAPLEKAKDAIEVNTTSISIDGVVERILEIVKERA